MNNKLLQYFKKLYVIRWTIGISRCSLENIIRTRVFDPDISWIDMGSLDKFYADPFIHKSDNGNIDIFLEEFAIDEDYGKLSIMRMDSDFNKTDYKILLDTKNHLSYPFLFVENNRIFVFPEARQTGKLSCYEYDPVHQSVVFLQDIIDMPLVDSTIIKHNNKYWIIGAIGNQHRSSGSGEPTYKLFIFFSDNLLGPYTPHQGNPVKNSLDGSRPAGNIIKVDNVLYRPAQNCGTSYGESITINRINTLTEESFKEEPYLFVSINRKNRHNSGIHSIHTINASGDLMVVDGEKWTLAPLNKLSKRLKERFSAQKH